MSTSAMEVRLSERVRTRLREVARHARQSEEELAARLIEGALAADEIELETLRRRLAQADAGGPFVRHEDVLAWLEAVSKGIDAPAPKATATR